MDRPQGLERWQGLLQWLLQRLCHHRWMAGIFAAQVPSAAKRFVTQKIAVQNHILIAAHAQLVRDLSFFYPDNEGLTPARPDGKSVCLVLFLSML